MEKKGNWLDLYQTLPTTSICKASPKKPIKNHRSKRFKQAFLNQSLIDPKDLRILGMHVKGTTWGLKISS